MEIASTSAASEPESRTPVVHVSFNQTTSHASFDDDEFSGQDELTLSDLKAQVEGRNPSLQAMAAAWQAAALRYPQVVSLDDPMFMAMAAPTSFNSSDVESAYALQASQRFPWFGKLAASGRQARSEAAAACQDLEDSRLRLAEITHVAFLDYYLVRRQLDVYQQNLVVMRQFRDAAQTKYRTNQVTQQDVLQADLELADLERRRFELERMDQVATARINTLLQRAPNAPLPPPPAQLDVPTREIDVALLRQLAMDQRPDLAALAARIRAEQAAVTLASKEYYPDVEIFGRYDSFWQPASTQSDLRGQAGVNVNVPIYHHRLDAAVREAVFRVRQRRAEYEQRRLDIEYEIQSIYAQLEESRQTLEVYTEKLIPASERNVAAARADYDVGKATFLNLAVAQRKTIELREKGQEALAIYHRRLAELQRAVGGPFDTELRVQATR